MAFRTDEKILIKIREIAHQEPNKQYTLGNKKYSINEVISEIDKRTTPGRELYQILQQYFRTQ